MAHAHNHSVLGFRRYFKAFGEPLADCVQRMISSDLEFPRKALEYPLVGVSDGGRFAVDRIIQDAQFAAERLDNTLEAEANTKNGDPPLHRVPNSIGNAKILRTTRARGDQ